MTDEVVEPKRLVFPGLAGLYEKISPYSYALMRFSTGAVLVPHGIVKILHVPPEKFAENLTAHDFPMPLLLTYLVYFTESVAAACMAIGLFTRVAAAMVWLQMSVIIVVFQWQYGYFWTNRGIEFALLWWLLCTAIFFRGGGRCSIDRMIGREI
ncbi:MAG TPA: DoxX family protein [Stellaceae bacterium]|nr:DoxX family protein [Stellaceae bacterium]